MTKPETDFADEDLAMARRALWLLESPSRMAEQPPPDLDLMRLSNFSGPDGVLLPLAHFALMREADALRSGRPSATAKPKEAKMREEACAAEKKANEQLREAKLRIGNALEHWRAALETRAEVYGRVPPWHLTGDPLAILAALLDAEQKVATALEVTDQAMRWQLWSNASDPFPSLLGLPKAQRNAGLNAQALRLHEAGCSDEQITYVMDWARGTPEQIQKRMRVRLDETRALALAAAQQGP
jgi:hypothetical protein